MKELFNYEKEGNQILKESGFKGKECIFIGNGRLTLILA